MISRDMTTAEIDVLETLGRPEYPAAVQWSEDNLLAVAAGSAVLIVNPCQVRGPRGSTVLPEPSMNVLQVDQYPVTPKDSVTYASTYLRTRGLCSQRNSQLASSKLGIRSVSWSPLGCDLPGNALLASVTENHQVRVHASPVGCQTQWHTVIELSSKLKQISQEESWQSVDSLQALNSLSAPDDLRLRGGASPRQRKQKPEALQQQASQPTRLAKAMGSPKGQQGAHLTQPEAHLDPLGSTRLPAESSHQYHIGDSVEVMSGEEGLQGSWFTGTINQLQHGFALVAYDELNVSEDSGEKLQEWFSLPGATEDSQALLDPTHDAHLGPDFQIRPPPPAELAMRGSIRAVHDDVDAFDDGGWWEGRVTEVLKARYKVQPLASTHVLSVKKADIRSGVVWDQHEWRLRQPQEWKVAQPAETEGLTKPRKRKYAAAAPAAVPAAAAADAAESSSSEEPSRKSRSRSQKPTPYKLPEGFSAADLPSVEVTSNKAGRAALARASAARFFELRHEVPEEKLPKYENHKDHLAAVDAGLVSRIASEFWAVHSEAMDTHEIVKQQYVKGFRDKLRLCWDRVLDPRAEHVHLDKRVRGAQANVDIRQLVQAGSGHAGEASNNDEDKDGKATKKTKPAPEAYQVPADFDKSVLGEVDLSSKDAAELSLPHCFWLRWMQLRQQIPEGERESYAKGQHLRGADALNADRAKAEIVATFGEEMARYGFSEKQLVTLGKQLIRHRLIQTQAVFATKPQKEWTGAEEQQLRKLAKRRRTATGMSDDDTQLLEDVPTYTVPDDFDRACLGAVDLSSKEKGRKSLPLAFKRRWLDLRSQMAESEVPVYTSSEHFQGVDARNAEQTRAEMMAAYGSEMQAVGFTEAWLTAAGKQLIWQRFLQAKLRRPGQSRQASENDGQEQDNDQARPSTARKALRRKPSAATPATGADAEAAAADVAYEVPADFDPAVLGSPDFSSKDMAEKTLAALFLKRWWDLRDQDPTAEHETYRKGQHLKGLDAANAERVRAEMMSAFKEEMKRINMSEKVLVRDGKRAIRADLNTRQQPPDLLDDDGNREELGEAAVLITDTSGRRPRRKAAVSASKTLRATRDSPDAPSSDDEYKGDSEQEGEEANTDEDEVDNPTDTDDDDILGDDMTEVSVPNQKKRKIRAARVGRQASSGGAQSAPDKPVPMNLTPQAYLHRLDSLAALQAAWSPICTLTPSDGSGVQRFAMLAVGCKAGIVWLWRYQIPSQYTPAGSATPEAFTLVGGCRAQRSWVTALSWAASPAHPSPPPSPPSHQPHDHLHQQDELLLISGSSDGCLRLHGQFVGVLGAAKGQGAGALLGGQVLQLRKTLHEVDLLGVTCASVKLAEATTGSRQLLIAAGKSGGALVTCSISLGRTAAAASRGKASSASPELQYSPVQVRRGAHSTRHVTGVAWAAAGITLSQQQSPEHQMSSQQSEQQQQSQKPSQQQQQQQQQALLMSCGGDGRVRQWRMSFEEGAEGLEEAECPKAWSSPSLEKDAAFSPGGLAVSGNGLVMAVAVDNGTTAIAAVQQDMIYKRLYNGNVVIRSLCGSPPHLLDPATAATAVADQLRLVALHPKRLWDVAHVLKQHAEAAVTAAAAVSAAAGHTKSAAEAVEGSVPGAEEDGAVEAGAAVEEAEGRLQLTQQQAAVIASSSQADTAAETDETQDMLTLDQAVAQSTLVQAVLQILERPYYQLQETPAGLEAQVPSPVWQGLQAATALRRLLHPSRLLPQQAEVCEEPPWQQLATATHLAQPPPAQPSGVTASKPHIHDWEQALQKNELQLLQLHMIQALSLPGVGGREEMQQLSQVLMADWVTMHAGQAWLQSGLLQLAHQVHARHNITDAASPGSVPAREQSAWFGVDLRLEGTPLGSAQCIPASEALPISLQRCAASLLMCESTQLWHCQLCSRRYKNLDLFAARAALPCCLYCGINLGVTPPQQALRPPALL